MLKYFYKTFSTFILILALLNLQITPTYAQAQNQEQATSTSNQEAREAYNESGGSSGGGNGNSQAEGGEEGGEMASRMMSVSTDSVNVHLGDMLVFITLIALGLFLISVWKYQAMALDMQIAMGAGIIQIGSVISTIFATRADIDAGTYEVEKKEDGTVNNMQVDALKEQKKSYVALKDHAALKWKIEAAGAAAYAGAAVMAYKSKMKLDTLFSTCSNALKTNKCMSFALPGVMKANMEKPGPSEAKLAARKTSIATLKSAPSTCTGQSGVDASAAQSAATLACTPLIEHLTVEEPLMKASVPDEATGSLLNKDIEKFFDPNVKVNLITVTPIQQLLPVDNQPDFISEGGLEFLGPYSDANVFNKIVPQHSEVLSFQERVLSTVIPSAQALDMANMKWIGLGGAALAAFYFFRKQLVAFIDKYTTNPGHRAIMYLGASAVSSAAAYMSYSAMGQAEKNIERIDKMLEKLGELQNMGKNKQKQKQQDIGLAGGLEPSDKTPEVRLSDDEDPVSCNQPLKNGKCPSIEQGIQKSKSFKGLDPRLGEIGTLTGGIADDITGSASLGAGTVGDIEKLADKNAIAKRGLRQIEAYENEKRKKNGQEPVDFEKQANSMMNKMAKITKDGLEQKGSSAGGIMAAMGYPESMRGGSDKDLKKKLAESLKEADGVKASKVASPSDDSEESFDFDFGEEEAEGDEIFQGDIEEYNTDMYAKAFDVQASKGSDQIVGDRDVSIFRVISVRYMKSGLPRLLEELRAPEQSRLEELE